MTPWWVDLDAGGVLVFAGPDPGDDVAGPFATELEAWQYAADVLEDRRRLNAPHLAAAKRKVRRLHAKAERAAIRLDNR